MSTLHNDVQQFQRKVKDLEDHIQSDDRAEKLEASLKDTRDRADELEFQLSKLRQVMLAYIVLITED